VKPCKECTNPTRCYNVVQDQENGQKSARRVQEIIWREKMVVTLRILSEFKLVKDSIVVHRRPVQDVHQANTWKVLKNVEEDIMLACARA